MKGEHDKNIKNDPSAQEVDANKNNADIEAKAGEVPGIKYEEYGKA